MGGPETAAPSAVATAPLDSSTYSSTYVGLRRDLSTFVEDCPILVENLVDEVGAGPYCPSSAPQLRTVRWVTALAKGSGKPDRTLD